MNKHIRWFVLALALTALLAGVRPALTKASPPADLSHDNKQPPMASGVVLVGLEPGVTLDKGKMGVQSTDAALNKAFGDIGVQGVEPVFAEAGRSLGTTSAGDEAP